MNLELSEIQIIVRTKIQKWRTELGDAFADVLCDVLEGILEELVGFEEEELSSEED